MESVKIPPKRKIGFVCSGGATKAGAFHLGVALALQEHGFTFRGGLAPAGGGAPARPGPLEIATYVGSSAGSMVASFLAAGFTLESIFNSFLGKPPTPGSRELPRLTYQKMFRLRPELAIEQLGRISHYRKFVAAVLRGDWESLLEFRWLKANGIFSIQGVEEYLREEALVSNRFQDYVADLFVVATQLNHSRKVVFGKYSYAPPEFDLSCQYENDVPISAACAASMALPVVFAPYTIERGGQRQDYVDGEIRDTLSSHVAVDSGCDLVIASYSHQPYHFQKETGSLTQHGLPAILVQSIYLLIEQKINQYVHGKVIQGEAIDAVDRYCREAGVDPAHRARILEILEHKLHHRRDVDIVYIHPDPNDAQMFFGQHFSLNPNAMGETVRSGFRAAISTLKRYEFADRAPGVDAGLSK